MGLKFPKKILELVLAFMLAPVLGGGVYVATNDDNIAGVTGATIIAGLVVIAYLFALVMYAFGLMDKK